MIVDFSYYVGIMQVRLELDCPLVRVPTTQQDAAMKRKTLAATKKELHKCL